MLIFLDFDGVLRRADSPQYQLDEDCLVCFQDSVRALGDVQIVISSSWKDAFSLEDIKGRFDPDIADRIVGTTPSAQRIDGHAREEEVEAFLRARGWEQRRWIAIDDVSDHYEPAANLVLTDPTRGFDRDAAVSLRQMAEAMREPGEASPTTSP